LEKGKGVVADGDSPHQAKIFLVGDCLEKMAQNYQAPFF
jgi:hypothetical protein